MPDQPPTITATVGAFSNSTRDPSPTTGYHAGPLVLGPAFTYAGQWEIPGGGCRISTARKPCLFHRLTMRLAFGWKWVPL